MRLGILGGSFNPIHHGHLVIATCAAEALKLDKVLFVPTAISPLKDPRNLAPPRDRWSMLRLALRGNPGFEACDLELRRGGVSYTVDTLRALKRTTRARLVLILGTDAFEQMPRWKEAAEVRRLASVAVVPRPGHRPRPGMPKHYMVEAPLLDVSSREIRARARKGLPIRYLVPDPVERYVRRKGLYR
jgi:nicotinate-nucleotide adenylyltransferase